MTIHDGASPGPPGPIGSQPSSGLVAVPRYKLEQRPPLDWAELAEARRALGMPRPEEFGSTLGEQIAASLAFLETVSQPERQDRGPDYILVDLVDGQLRTLLVQAKWAPYGAERERARLGVFAALNARGAILGTRTVDGWKPAVAEFAATWLGIPNPDSEWLEAVSMALLGNWVDLLDEHLVDDVGSLGLKQLKKESAVVHRQLQPLWRRKAAGGRLLSLDHPIPGGGTLVGLLADRAAPQEPSLLWEPETESAAAVFAGLSPGEQQVARVWAQSGRTSWAEAADLAGVSAAEADSVRRKLRRLGRRYEQRAASARVTSGRSLPGGCGSWA
uniref:Uncharacterized protein n=1 Tax=Streptomyces sp. FR1 TaxID=349971 RepID=V9Z425_9ACTN|nr:hypothetical protein [Streptomyces sp. FR1]AHE38838.1 Hypothetical protein pFRL3_61 [Streptomyces sp. FR1]